MRIAIIRKECTFFRGGAERYCANLCRTMSQMGHKVFVLSRECDSDIHPSITHVPVAVNTLSSSTKNRSFHLNSQKALKKLKVDRVYALSRSYPADAFRVSDPLHRFWMDIRYPGRIENFLQKINPRHRTILDLERGIFHADNTKLIITNSRLTKNQVIKLYPFPEERIHVVYNGVDLKKFSPRISKANSNNTHIRLLFVAMDFKRKGLEHIVKALARLKQKAITCSLQVVGRDKTRPYKKKAAKLGVADLLEFVGPSKNVEDYYRTADLLVFPTRYDPFANVCLEALACGLPVVTTSANGAAEIIDEGFTGYILNGNQPLSEQIVDKVKEFKRLSPNARYEMARQARERAEEFTILNNVQKTVELLNQF